MIPTNPILLVQRGDWVAQTIQLQASTRQEAVTLKYLSIQTTLNNTSSPKLDKLSEDTQRLALRIVTRRETLNTKTNIYNTNVLPRIDYCAPHLIS